jgi:hypothetical protein
VSAQRGRAYIRPGPCAVAKWQVNYRALLISRTSPRRSSFRTSFLAALEERAVTSFTRTVPSRFCMVEMSFSILQQSDCQSTVPGNIHTDIRSLRLSLGALLTSIFKSFARAITEVFGRLIFTAILWMLIFGPYSRMMRSSSSVQSRFIKSFLLGCVARPPAGWMRR